MRPWRTVKGLSLCMIDHWTLERSLGSIVGAWGSHWAVGVHEELEETVWGCSGTQTFGDHESPWGASFGAKGDMSTHQELWISIWGHGVNGTNHLCGDSQGHGTDGSISLRAKTCPPAPNGSWRSPQQGVPPPQVLRGRFPGQEQGHTIPGLQTAPLQQVGNIQGQGTQRGGLRVWPGRHCYGVWGGKTWGSG